MGAVSGLMRVEGEKMGWKHGADSGDRLIQMGGRKVGGVERVGRREKGVDIKEREVGETWGWKHGADFIDRVIQIGVMKVGGECVGGKEKVKAGRDTDLFAGRCIDSGQRVGGQRVVVEGEI